MIKILLLTISFFLLIFLESFLLKVFSFSLFVVLAISFWKKIDNTLFFLFVTLFTLMLDTVLHTPLGVHMIVISLSVILVEILWFLIPRDDTFGFVPVFLVVFFYHTAVVIFTSFLQDSVFPTFTFGMLLGNLVKGIFSIPIYILVKRVSAFVRNEDTGEKIRLR